MCRVVPEPPCTARPSGLVQHHDIGVLVEDHVLERLERFCRRLREASGEVGRIQLERRNADALALFDPVLAVGALAVDAQLAFADDALDMGERQAGETRLQKAVDPHVVLVRGHDHGLNLGRQRRRFGDDLLGLGNERRRLRRARRGSRETRRRLATRTMRRRPLGLRAPIRARALGAIACWAFRQWSLDAAAHGGCGSKLSRWVAQKQRIVTVKSVQISARVRS